MNTFTNTNTPIIETHISRIDPVIADGHEFTSKVLIHVLFWSNFAETTLTLECLESTPPLLNDKKQVITKGKVELLLKANSSSTIRLKKPLPVLFYTILENGKHGNLSFNTKECDVFVVTIEEEDRPTGTRTIVIYEDTDIIDTTV